MDTLNIIGCGRTGRTLGRLFSSRGIFNIGYAMTRSQATAKAACSFMGAGAAVTSLSEIGPAEAYLLGVPDDVIAETAELLAGSGLLRPGDVVFHCSGSAASDLLESCRTHGALTASVHPVKSLADPARAVQAFGGTYCGFEGNSRAVEKLKEVFRRIGAIPFDVASEGKMLYHAGAVIACNYLTVLVEVALMCYESAGMERDTALKVLGPLVRNTVENNLALGPVAALTGPVARGDHKLVAAQHQALNDMNPDVGEMYRVLGQFALELAATQGSIAPDALAALQNLLETK